MNEVRYSTILGINCTPATDWFSDLDPGDQLIILEMALMGLRNREYRAELDLSDDFLDPIEYELSEFMGAML